MWLWVLTCISALLQFQHQRFLFLFFLYFPSSSFCCGCHNFIHFCMFQRRCVDLFTNKVANSTIEDVCYVHPSVHFKFSSLVVVFSRAFLSLFHWDYEYIRGLVAQSRLCTVLTNKWWEFLVWATPSGLMVSWSKWMKVEWNSLPG